MSTDDLCRLIPHSGAMCLLDEVLFWDQKQIHCRTLSHQSADNPLRCDQGLSSLQGIEYCAQAMAVHGGLLAQQQGVEMAAGYLAAARQVELNCQWLQDIKAPLEVIATQLLSDRGSFIYECEMTAHPLKIVSARITVVTSS